MSSPEFPAHISFLVAMFVSTLLTPIVARIAISIGWIDRPGGAKTHEHATPYGGGIAIIIAFLAVLCFVRDHLSSDTFAILIASMVVMIGGIIDDWKPLSPAPKLILQFLAAALLIFFDVRLRFTLIPDSINILLTLIWIVGVTNAVNMIDIKDELCGRFTVITSAVFGVVGYLSQAHEFAYLSFALCGAANGFIIYNRRPARIFMGDTGSQFIGFVLAAAVLPLNTFRLATLCAILLATAVIAGIVTARVKTR